MIRGTYIPKDFLGGLLGWLELGSSKLKTLDELDFASLGDDSSCCGRRENPFLER